MKAIELLKQSKAELIEQKRLITAEIEEINRALYILEDISGGETDEAICESEPNMRGKVGKHIVKFTRDGMKALDTYKSIRECYDSNEVEIGYSTFCRELSEGCVETNGVKYKVVRR